ncbi:hypothetical protein ACVIIV_002142 [Bradyrhizobium sp. USDA 4354]
MSEIRDSISSDAVTRIALRSIRATQKQKAGSSIRLFYFQMKSAGSSIRPICLRLVQIGYRRPGRARSLAPLLLMVHRMAHWH